jgi:hypothetical protein
VFFAAMFVIGGCSGEPTGPGQPAGGTPLASFQADLDPGASSFVITRVPGSRPGQVPVEVELVGSNLVSDPLTMTVSLDVAIRNLSGTRLTIPAQVWLSDLRPAGIEVLSSNFFDPPWRASPAAAPGAGAQPAEPAGPTHFGFDYSSLVGPDSVLSPEESSQARVWQFRVPNLASFSFAAAATFGGEPGGPVISGVVFQDLDGDGVRDPDDPPFSGGITLRRPSGVTAGTRTLDGGAYTFPASEVGLHRLTFEKPPLDCLCEVVETTPNPLQLVLLPDADGRPISYLHADFGARIVRLEEIQPVVPTDPRPGELHLDPYQLTEVGRAGDILTLRAGFGGCSPFHPFTLFMSGGFMESDPVRSRLVLGHDARGELCDGWFERTLQFDLTPLRRAFEQAYGRPGPVLLQFTDLQGNHHDFLYSWDSPEVGDVR